MGKPEGKRGRRPGGAEEAIRSGTEEDPRAPLPAPKGHRNKARGWPTEEAYPGVTAGGEPSPKGMWTGAYAGRSAAVAKYRNAPLRNTFGVGLPSPGIPG